MHNDYHESPFDEHSTLRVKIAKKKKKREKKRKNGLNHNLRIDKKYKRKVANMRYFE